MKIRLLVAASFLLMASLGCRYLLRGSPSSQAASKTIVGQLSSGGVTRTYRLHLPAGYQATKHYPLVLNFHGSGSNGTEQETMTDMSDKADAAGFVVVYPDGLDERWNTGPGSQGQADRQFVRDLIAAISKQYSIDPRRIYATGISNGGGMVDRLACDMSDVIAAIAPDAGAYNFWQDCSPSRPVPVLAFHGLNDLVVPYDGGSPPSMEPPIEDWAAAWAERDGCSTEPDLSTPLKDVTITSWGHCRGDAEVILYSLANHGHSWPGSSTMPLITTSQAVNATDLMWDFFQAHPMP